MNDVLHEGHLPVRHPVPPAPHHRVQLLVADAAVAVGVELRELRGVDVAALIGVEEVEDGLPDQPCEVGHEERVEGAEVVPPGQAPVRVEVGGEGRDVADGGRGGGHAVQAVRVHVRPGQAGDHPLRRRVAWQRGAVWAGTLWAGGRAALERGGGTPPPCDIPGVVVGGGASQENGGVGRGCSGSWKRMGTGASDSCVVRRPMCHGRRQGHISTPFSSQGELCSLGSHSAVAGTSTRWQCHQ